MTCQSLGDALTTIDIESPAAGVQLVLDSADGVGTKSVAIRDIGGFTGTFQEGVQGTVQTRMIGQTYEIDGTAAGFNANNPSFKTTRDFTVRVAC